MHELLELWGYESIHTASSNAKFFCDNIKSGNAEFWTLDHEGELVGELYAFYDLEDKDFADGKSTAYLCAFRIRTDLRGQGLGTKLICHVIEHIKDLIFIVVRASVHSISPKFRMPTVFCPSHEILWLHRIML